VRGTNRVRDLVEPKDFFLGRTDAPIRFEIEVELEATTYGYAIAFEFPAGFRELRVLEEKLTVDGKPVYTENWRKCILQKAARRRKRNSLSTGTWWLCR